MKSLRWGAVACAIAIMGSAVMTGCHPTFLVVPGAERDTVIDTVRVTDGRTRLTPIRPGPTRVDTVVRVDTVHDPITRIVVRTDTVLRVDTVLRADPITRIVVRTDTVLRVDTLVRVDTVVARPLGTRPTRPTPARVDTVVRVDTVEVATTDTIVRLDTVRVTVTDTITDTIVRVDTVRVAVTDTIVRVDTVRVAGQRLLFLPPGHEPPEGQCRVWVHGLPPGQQAKAAACTALGAIPAGAFILFGGDAWDFDYDWLAEDASSPGSVPPEIIALQRQGRGR